MTAPILPTIYQTMARVLADLPAIGKNQRNQQQGYAFRGIDDVLDALNPLLAKHGVFFVPEVLERLESARQTRNGGTMWVVNLHVRYTFYGPQGDCVVASSWGEGTDSGDKATQKAMTGALKYVLFQVFAIATHEQAEADADRTTPEPTANRSGSEPRLAQSQDASGSEPSVEVPRPSTPAGGSVAVSPPGAGPPATSPDPTKVRPTPPGPVHFNPGGASLEKAISRASALSAIGVDIRKERDLRKLPELRKVTDERQWADWLALLDLLEARADREAERAVKA